MTTRRSWPEEIAFFVEAAGPRGQGEAVVDYYERLVVEETRRRKEMRRIEVSRAADLRMCL